MKKNIEPKLLEDLAKIGTLVQEMTFYWTLGVKKGESSKISKETILFIV